MSSFELIGPHDLGRVGPRRLADLLGINGRGRAIWDVGELGAIFVHQLGASLREDLGPLNSDVAAALDDFEAMTGRSPASFGDLLSHPDPPPEILEVVKRFAKAKRQSTDATIPDEVATVLYYAALAAALVRHGRRIGTMDDNTLRQGFGWGESQPWVDGPTRSLLAEAPAALSRLAQPS